MDPSLIPAKSLHLVFRDPYLLEEVFGSFDPTNDPATKEHLFSAARACKAFQNPALDVLWGSLDSFVPLLKLFPPTRLTNNVYVFCRILDASDGDRFNMYAKKVRSFTLKEESRGTVPSVAQSTYMSLLQFRPKPFPALKNLRVNALSPLLQHWPLFVFADAARLEMNGIQLDKLDLVSPFISTLASSSSSSSMRHVILRGTLSPLSLSPLVHFAGLRSLDLSDAIGMETLKQIGTLEFLKTVSVRLKDVPPVDEYIGFPRLESLTIKGTFPLVQSVLDKIETPHLVDIDIEAVSIMFEQELTTEELVSVPRIRVGAGSRFVMTDEWHTVTTPVKAYPQYDLWNGCFVALSSRWQFTLRSIKVSLDEASMNIDRPFLPLGLFTYLLPLTKLESMSFNNCRFRPTRDELSELASACPGIRELRLSIGDCISGTNETFDGTDEMFESGIGRTVTVDALWPLAERCPDLSSLCIGLDVKSLPPIIPHKISSHHLRNLHVGSLPEPRDGAKLLEIARHIDRLFPYLEEIKPCPGYSSDDWKYIGEMVKAYQHIRSDDTYRRSSASTSL